jgi:hypothetical protein
MIQSANAEQKRYVKNLCRRIKMKILKWIGIVLVALLVVIGTFLWYMGYFNTLTVSEQEAGPFTYVYERFVGPYWETSKVFLKVEGRLKADGIPVEKALGVYYDDPAQVAEEKLRSDCGLVIAEKDISKVQSHGSKYDLATMQKKRSVIVEFPVKNKLSYMLAPMRGYPELKKYALEKGYKMAMPYELYEKDKILFIMEIAK